MKQYFKCDYCNKEFDSYAAAEACEAKHMEDDLKKKAYEEEKNAARENVLALKAEFEKAYTDYVEKYGEMRLISDREISDFVDDLFNSFLHY